MIRSMSAFADALPAGFDGVFLWDFLRSAWGGTKIQPMDFDCVVERCGHFLAFETKAPGVPIPEGQQITFDALVRDPHWTVVYCAKRPEDICGWDVQTRFGRNHFTGDAAALRSWCALWFIHVSARRGKDG
jgi:hypothetical protein